MYRIHISIHSTYSLCVKLQVYRSEVTKQFHSNVSYMKQLIRKQTVLTNQHLTPEIKLHLITRDCELWWSKGDSSPFSDPYWAFYWPGGQVLTRYILDHPYEFKNKTVLDIGSGCGASAIASKIVGARSVIANDIDAFAVVAMDMNAEANNVFINTSADNLIGLDNIDCDILLLGDMFYDTEFTDVMFNWIKQLNDRQSTYILIGDPGRLAFSNHQLSPNLKLVSQIDLPDMCQEENNGFQTGYVWTC